MIFTYEKKLTFILTGSSARKLKREQANLLAGRAIYSPFTPFSFEEVGQQNFLTKLEERLMFGLLPKAYLSTTKIAHKYLNTYTHTYLKEEVQQAALVRDLAGFTRFLELAASLNGAPIHFANLGKKIKISAPTIKEYYQILKDTLLVFEVPAWTHSVKKQLQQASKYYFFDNGVLAALNGLLGSELKEHSATYGLLFENLVITELIKYNLMHDLQYSFYNYRTMQRQEVDLIIQKRPNTNPIIVEIKSSKHPTAKDVKAINKIASDLPEFPDCKKIVLCNCDRAYEDEGIIFYPFCEGIVAIGNI